METYICPSTATCPVYENWVSVTKDRRANIVFGEGSRYSCLALAALEDPTTEGGILPSDKLKARISDPGIRDNTIRGTSCVHLEILNNTRGKE